MSMFMQMAMRGARGPFVENFFSVGLYTGNGATRNITNSLDLLNQGGLIITRRRDSPLTGSCSDTVTGVNNGYYLGASAARANFSSPTAYLTNGYTVGNASQFNTSAATYAAWSFRRAQRFLDVVSFTSDGTSNQRIAHGLGIAPGMVMVHATTASGSFIVYNKAIGRGYYGNLSTTSAFAASSGAWGAVDPTALDMGFNGTALGFPNGTACVMYLFADDSGSKGLIRAGVLSTNSSGAGSVNFGWQPEMVMIKLAYGASDWECFDQTRGWATNNQRILAWSGSASENAAADNIVLPTANGFQIVNGWTSSDISYLAVRKGPMKT